MGLDKYRSAKCYTFENLTLSISAASSRMELMFSLCRVAFNLVLQFNTGRRSSGVVLKRVHLSIEIAIRGSSGKPQTYTDVIVIHIKAADSRAATFEYMKFEIIILRES